MTTTFPPEAAPLQTDPPATPAPPASRAERIGLLLLLVGTAVMYLWHITVNGMGNQFYAGSAWAGSRNWEALLFGSLDPQNFITVDKPPMSQWVMGLSGQLFGFSSASMLIPEALMAVITVALLYASVARVSDRRAGLLAGAVFALTPVAALMFRFNNPDAAMVLMMMVAAYCTVRALDRGSARWMAFAGVALGFAFLAKMLEGLMVMPAVAVVYLIAAPVVLRRRLAHLLGALVAFALASGWFVVLTMLWPAASRPYLAGSTDNNFMNLVLGYNGFSRVLGHNQMGGPGSNGPPENVGGYVADQLHYSNATHGFGGWGDQTQGLSRLFSGEFGFEIGWLIPAALLATVLILIVRWRAPRTDKVRAGALLFGSWIVVDGVVLSFMHGTIHPYYCLSLTPAVAGSFAIGVREMWLMRRSWLCRTGLAAIIASTALWSVWILRRNSDWLPSLRWAIVALVVAAAVAMALSFMTSRSFVTARRARILGIAALVFGLLGALAGPAAYAVSTIGAPHTGGGPTVGPADDARGFGGWGQQKDDPQLDALLGSTHTRWSAAISGSSAAAALELTSQTPVMAIGGFSGRDPVPTLPQFQADVAAHQVSYFLVRDRNGRGMGGPFGGRGHADITDWVAKTFAPTKMDSMTVYDLSAPK